MKIRDITNKDLDFKDLKNLYSQCGFQASNLSTAIEIIERMKEENATVFLTFTANMVASGLRGIFAELCRKKFVDVIITTGGSIDHDIIRTEKDYQLGSFLMDDTLLHREGTNRLGNILVKNECYEFLEQKLKPFLEKLYTKKKSWSPSEFIDELGKEINDEGSFINWAAKNNIPVFSPGITDSAIGLQLHFFKQRHSDFVLDVTGDMSRLSSIVLDSKVTGGIILGGGISKHHAIGVNILRDGFDYAVYVTTASPWDGSLSGARTQEAVSWGKIREKASQITVDCDATIAFPLIISKFLR